MIDYDTITYNEYILNIIATRGQWNIPEGEFFEGHHIIPKSCGGSGDYRKKDANIIWLYPKEHYIAHYLLTKENPDNLQFARAFICMQGMNHRTGFLLEDAELFEKSRIEMHRCASMNAKAAAAKASPEERKRRASFGGRGRKRQLEDPAEREAWSNSLKQRHANMSADEKSKIYTKSSKSLSKYYAEVDRSDDDWVKRQEQNRKTNIETSKAWRSEFYNLFHRTPESYRKYGLLKDVMQLFKEIRNLSEEEQLEAVKKFNCKVEEIV